MKSNASPKHFRRKRRRRIVYDADPVRLLDACLAYQTGERSDLIMGHVCGLAPSHPPTPRGRCPRGDPGPLRVLTRR